MPTIYMLCGFIGSGKSTYARQLAEQQRAFILSNDQFTVGIFGNNPDQEILNRHMRPIEDLQLKLCAQLLKLGLDVIFDCGFWSRRSRDELRAFACQQGAQLTMFYFTAPVTVMRERAVARTQSLDEETFFIDDNIWNKLHPLFEPPQSDEDFQAIQTG